jgi:hypothetical protein
VIVAFSVERCCISGAITLASGPVDEPEFVTATHSPPRTPLQEPMENEPRDFSETPGSIADAPLRTVPVHTPSPSQDIAAPDADAADGPIGSRLVLISAGSAASARDAPRPDEAVDTERASQPPDTPVHDAGFPCDVRGLPPFTAPSHAVLLVRTDPVQRVPASHCR